MKNIFTIAILLSVSVSGCFAQQETKSKNKMKYNFGTCHDERETVKKIENIKGAIIKINDALWALKPDGENVRYGLCEIPEELKKENMSITFSGEVKKINPNERMAAAPFKVTSLTITK
ncbi:MAG TPA: hypothetical protein DEH02_13725 [Bacteroidales bacterium]|nr:MAG: hypothetical protein A2X01_14015 [Bacteroidetes bacterium GWF2_35_48]HBX52117.1 hypothetical protein [Bacteroidales bacterium]